MVITDYYSNFTEFKELQNTNSENVIINLKDTFSRYGIPDQLVTDNGP